jgi:calcium/calmodulin-dependent protein kinase kinase 2
MVKGLDYVHSQSVVHGDIKPANILIDFQARAKLSDFGSAAVLPSGTKLVQLGEVRRPACACHTGRCVSNSMSSVLFTRQCPGTPQFTAPEVFGLDKTGTYDGFAADVYALGATLFTLVVGHPPFSATTVLKLAEIVQSTDATIPP